MVSIAACLSFSFLYSCHTGAQETNSSGKDLASHNFSGVLFSMQRGLLVGEIRATVFDKSSIWFQWGLGFLHPWQVGAHLEARVVNST